jgi:ABC-type polysaccharide/polyol phosphate transport system ATPase subunit
MIDDTSICLDNISVCYRIPSERIRTFKEYAIRWVQRKIQLHSFWALHDVSMNIKQGEVFGVIGANGAGKSTLLKLIARVIPPSSGRVRVIGRVAPLLELGAGFHPELSGRENIYLNGAMLGFSRKEMDAKFDRIVDFAELWEFIDAPMRTYSSGMWARLGFSVATDTKPDILIIDEILGVGDEAFQKKSSTRILSFRDQEATILMVSHNSFTVETLCQRAAWLDHGHLMVMGEAKDVVAAYRASQNAKS